ncbi:hypothetical protein BN946_scf184845.g32 [Trametes cinnabarina]|uniref:Cytochrome P450 n=1 Tax=Pycnoporus cinnabarinus TaxID=5643 RepID=A0A060S9I3_PYCCI|nr:hypothetical protein BN946_scf184845.g32 [Trametes cinnabarina]
MGHPTLILGSFRAAQDLLDAKGAIYSDRPNAIMAGELVGWDRGLGYAHGPDNPRFREFRRLFHKFIGPRACQDPRILEMQEKETHRLMLRFIRDPKNFYRHPRESTGALILRLAYGYQTVQDRDHDPLVEVVEVAMKGFAKASEPGAFLVDNFPVMRYIPEWLMPRGGFKAVAREMRRQLDQMYDLPFNFVKEQMELGNARPSFTQEYLSEKQAPTAADEELIKAAAASLYSAEYQTPSSITACILAMCLWPDIQARAQRELDAVIGNSWTRLPTFSDRTRLPYVYAVVLEVLRWNPAVPLGLAHRLTQDDAYRGWHIPKGTVVWANIWSMLQDPAVFPEPTEFHPERFLDSKGHLRRLERHEDPSVIAFGFGRRICPGMYFAINSVFIGIATLLYTLNIAKERDDDRKEVLPKVDFTGFIRLPLDCILGYFALSSLDLNADDTSSAADYLHSLAGLFASRAVLQGHGVGNASASATNAIFLTVIQDVFSRLTTVIAGYYLGTSLYPEAKTYRLLADVLNDAAIICDTLSPHLAHLSLSLRYPFLTSAPDSSLRVLALCLSGSLRALCGAVAGGSKAALTVHFATAGERPGDVGDLSAKDGSKETVLALLGMVCGSVVLHYVHSARMTYIVLFGLLFCHLTANVVAVRVVALRIFNRQRASLAWTSFRDAFDGKYQGEAVTNSSVLDYRSVSRQERIFSDASKIPCSASGSSVPSVARCLLGLPFARISTQAARPQGLFRFFSHDNSQSYRLSDKQISACLAVFAEERYVLWFTPDPSYSASLAVVFKDEHSPHDHLKAWAHAHEVARICERRTPGKFDGQLEVVRDALAYTSRMFPTFIDASRAAGWKTEESVLVGGSPVTISVLETSDVVPEDKKNI